MPALYKALMCVMLTAILGSAAAPAQMSNDHVQWTLLTPYVHGEPGEVVQVRIGMAIVDGAHVYTPYRDTGSVMGPVSMAVDAGEEDLLSVDGDIRSDVPPIRKYDPNFEQTTEIWSGSVTLTVPIRISKGAPAGKHKGWIDFNFMTCTDSFCRPPTDARLGFTVDVER